ncbi:MAG: hypothetical protein P0S96_00470 [Simkaniaceae bacterium]|nr:hypothetical protein [Candidatus Sacchlamyda saccharinae]
MFEELFDELVVQQEERVFKMAEKIIPNITRDDVMQPNDFPQLENHPYFRYEEGVLEGLRTARMAYLAQNQN